MSLALLALVRRDLQMANRRRTEVLLPLAFFIVAAGLFPFGVGPEPQMLRQMAPGVIWVCALLAFMLSLARLFDGDSEDGSLEQMLLSPQPLVLLVVGKVFAQWLLTAMPIVVVAPLIALAFGMQDGHAVAMLVLTLLLGTPVLSLLGALGAALALGLRNGATLVFLLVLPLTLPTLLFGTGAVAAVQDELGARAHLSLMGALLILTALGAPWATAAALRISLD